MAKAASKQFKRDLIPPVCEIPDCGYEFFVTRHRIKRGKNGGKYIPGNVIGLCPNHHAEAEAGVIPQYVLFQIVHERLRNIIKSRDNGYNKRVRARAIPKERLTYIAFTPN